ncbi:glycerophosphoryl diester phosphodiesterase [Exophiala viscosa]|uniref:Glycerophosphoryl diester phosphodiesterase n=1 Tax=Exophiala viscosa TaxID=2486360 RepID=A0AAN6DV82_9EURO|nr:glycerophosphoryl diester phosphodiesterase [Exophiala viscosa]KAI1626363.1 glycerophosphoryl diester phosphodiesterase [Exophiala viscosa]
MHRPDPDTVEADTPLLKQGVRSIGKKDAHYGTKDNSQQHSKDAFPVAHWTWAKTYISSKHFPQTIAHRGYKAVYPENTMKAFEGAVEVGTHALETDIHLSKDGIVVLSHDPDLKRCFGVEKKKIIDCDWDYLKTLRTLKSPQQPMPQLHELLEYIAQPGLEHIWILLDIKMDNNADDVMRLIAKTLESVHPGQTPWNRRVVLGIWAAKFLPLCTEYLPGYPVSHIGFSTTYARQFLKVPNVSFNMLQRVLIGPFGARFIRDVRRAKRPLYAWTINEENLMRWCVRKELDGVITDDPKRFKQICDEWNDERAKLARMTLWQSLYTLWVWVLITIFSVPFRRKFPETTEQFIRDQNVRAKAASKVTDL